jgi:hypothetical protein
MNLRKRILPRLSGVAPSRNGFTRMHPNLKKDPPQKDPPRSVEVQDTRRARWRDPARSRATQVLEGAFRIGLRSLLLLGTLLASSSGSYCLTRLVARLTYRSQA